MLRGMVVSILAFSAGGSVFAGNNVPSSELEKQSYVLGAQVARDLKIQGFDGAKFDDAMLLQGLRDGLGGGKYTMKPEDMQAAMDKLRGELMKAQQAKLDEAKKTNKDEGAAFLAKNKSRKGVTTTASGLQYEVMTEGKGDKPSAADTVSVHYRGTLIDGSEFDSSYARNQPANFRLDQVIKGWTEGLQLMSVGSKWKLYVPPELGYGENGAGGVIGPNATLIFEVELLQVMK
jgi:FKBP-type peptidyl-prolyl cis-trans isomerase